jgi:hypothetical protein
MTRCHALCDLSGALSMPHVRHDRQFSAFPDGLARRNDLVSKGRLDVKTRSECRALTAYVSDRDFRVRYIAIQALLGATKADPSGISVGWFLDAGFEGHRKMVERFAERIDKMKP